MSGFRIMATAVIFAACIAGVAITWLVIRMFRRDDDRQRIAFLKPQIRRTRSWQCDYPPYNQPGYDPRASEHRQELKLLRDEDTIPM